MSQLTNTVPETARFVCHLHWSPLWLEISTPAYETNINCWPQNVFSGILYTYSSDKTNVQKSEISI